MEYGIQRSTPLETRATLDVCVGFHISGILEKAHIALGLLGLQGAEHSADGCMLFGDGMESQVALDSVVGRTFGFIPVRTEHFFGLHVAVNVANMQFSIVTLNKSCKKEIEDHFHLRRWLDPVELRSYMHVDFDTTEVF